MVNSIGEWWLWRAIGPGPAPRAMVRRGSRWCRSGSRSVARRRIASGSSARSRRPPGWRVTAARTSSGISGSVRTYTSPTRPAFPDVHLALVAAAGWMPLSRSSISISRSRSRPVRSPDALGSPGSRRSSAGPPCRSPRGPRWSTGVRSCRRGPVVHHARSGVGRPLDPPASRSSPLRLRKPTASLATIASGELLEGSSYPRFRKSMGDPSALGRCAPRVDSSRLGNHLPVHRQGDPSVPAFDPVVVLTPRPGAGLARQAALVARGMRAVGRGQAPRSRRCRPRWCTARSPRPASPGPRPHG